MLIILKTLSPKYLTKLWILFALEIDCIICYGKLYLYSKIFFKKSKKKMNKIYLFKPRFVFNDYFKSLWKYTIGFKYELYGGKYKTFT